MKDNNKTTVTISAAQQDRLVAMQDQRKVILGHIAAYNQAMSDNNAKARDKAADDLKSAEKDYAALALRDFCLQCVVENNDGTVNTTMTIENAIRRLTYDVLYHKEDKDTKRLSVATKSKDIDLLALCKICGIDKSWFNDVTCFNKRLALRCGHELHLKTSDLKKMDDSHYYEQLLREEANGGTPASNTQIAKEMQEIIDKILFVPGTKNKTKNRYRVKSEDVVYLVMLYLRRSKALRVKVLTDRPLLTLFVDVIHHIVTKKCYSMDCPWVKD